MKIFGHAFTRITSNNEYMFIFFKYTSRLPYSLRLKSQFILIYGLIGFVSSLAMLVYLLVGQYPYSALLFYTVLLAVPTLGTTAFLAWRALPLWASYTGLFALFLGCLASTVVAFPAFLSMIMVFVLSALFIPIKNQQLIAAFGGLLTTTAIKLLMEYGLLFGAQETTFELDSQTLFLSTVFLFSIFAYSLMIALLLNKGLKNSEKLIEVSEQLKAEVMQKQQFFSILAHDLKGPLGGVGQVLEAMVEKQIPATPENIKSLNESVLRSHNLLENILAWSRSQQNNLRVQTRIVDIGQCIDTAVELLAVNAELKKISVVKQYPSEYLAMADKSMVCTVVRNLLSNAIKYSNPGGMVVVSVEKLERELKVTITDNGIGMSAQTQAKIFDIDQENDLILGTNNEKGTGLGLILAAEFIQKNNGRIGAESQLGKGSSFWFVLPLGLENKLDSQ